MIDENFIFAGDNSDVALAINAARERVLSNSRSDAKKIVVVVTSSEIGGVAGIEAARQLKETGWDFFSRYQ